MVVHVVFGGGIILAAYTREDSAALHARCVTGAKYVTVDLMDSVPPEVREDIISDASWDDEDDTPVMSISLEDMDD